jgi:hypothetical protein
MNAGKIIICLTSYIFISSFWNEIAGHFATVDGPLFAHRWSNAGKLFLYWSVLTPSLLSDSSGRQTCWLSLFGVCLFKHMFFVLKLCFLHQSARNTRTMQNVNQLPSVKLPDRVCMQHSLCSTVRHLHRVLQRNLLLSSLWRTCRCNLRDNNQDKSYLCVKMGVFGLWGRVIW